MCACYCGVKESRVPQSAARAALCVEVAAAVHPRCGQGTPTLPVRRSQGTRLCADRY